MLLRGFGEHVQVEAGLEVGTYSSVVHLKLGNNPNSQLFRPLIAPAIVRHEWHWGCCCSPGRNNAAYTSISCHFVETLLSPSGSLYGETA